jgi:hypothetical protein
MSSSLLFFGGIALALCLFGTREAPRPESESNSLLELEVLSSEKSLAVSRLGTLPEGGTEIGVGRPCAVGLDARVPLNMLLATLRRLAESSERRGMREDGAEGWDAD